MNEIVFGPEKMVLKKKTEIMGETKEFEKEATYEEFNENNYQLSIVVTKAESNEKKGTVSLKLDPQKSEIKKRKKENFDFDVLSLDNTNEGKSEKEKQNKTKKQTEEQRKTISEILSSNSTGDYVGPAGRIPEGTILRGSHKGTIYEAKIQNRNIVLKKADGKEINKEYSSLSKAAYDILGYNENGWRFWKCKENNKWKELKNSKYYNETKKQQ